MSLFAVVLASSTTLAYSAFANKKPLTTSSSQIESECEANCCVKCDVSAINGGNSTNLPLSESLQAMTAKIPSPFTVKEHISNAANHVVGNSAISILNSTQVHDQWIGWLNRAFQHGQTHDALLYLLLNGIKDTRFVNESIEYGKDLIFHAVRQPAVLESSKQMTVDVLVNEARVV